MLDWVDAKLTKTGVEQAQAAHSAWRMQVEVRKMSLPQSYYTSPLRRAWQTTNLTFSGFHNSSAKPLVAVIKEVGVLLRVLALAPRSYVVLIVLKNAVTPRGQRGPHMRSPKLKVVHPRTSSVLRVRRWVYRKG